LELDEFRRIVLGYYEEHGRDLPWRHTRDPYRILVSEMMLQQTQVPRVEPKYQEFVAAFPDFETLAAAPLSEVLRVWSGLGYNRRARQLKELAEEVVREHGGKLPSTREELVALSGIGPATAAEVLAFAFGVPAPFIETNIRAVYLHHFFADACAVPDRELLPLIEETLDRDDPRRWYYALMDYGTHLKKALPNPCRRSAHHAKPTPYVGSSRYVRGQVVRALVEGAASADELADAIGQPLERVQTALAGLLGDGLVVAEDGRYRLPS